MIASRAMATAGAAPMGILASVAGEPVGWCAWPAVPVHRRHRWTKQAPAQWSTHEDESVWFVPCLFVRAGHRDQGITYVLVRVAIDLARREGAIAIEGWPVAGSDRRSSDAFLGREKVFEDLGFRCVEQPSPQRAIMRLEFTGTKRAGKHGEQGASGEPGDLEQAPFARDAPQRVGPAVGEPDGRTDHEILDRARHQHPALTCKCHDARGNVDRDPCDLSVLDLDLAAVQPRPNLDPQRADRRRDLRGTPHRASRAVEGCQESIPGRSDFLPL